MSFLTRKHIHSGDKVMGVTGLPHSSSGLTQPYVSQVYMYKARNGREILESKDKIEQWISTGQLNDTREIFDGMWKTVAQYKNKPTASAYHMPQPTASALQMPYQHAFQIPKASSSAVPNRQFIGMQANQSEFKKYMHDMIYHRHSNNIPRPADCKKIEYKDINVGDVLYIPFHQGGYLHRDDIITNDGVSIIQRTSPPTHVIITVLSKNDTEIRIRTIHKNKIELNGKEFDIKKQELEDHIGQNENYGIFRESKYLLREIQINEGENTPFERKDIMVYIKLTKIGLTKLIPGSAIIILKNGNLWGMIVFKKMENSTYYFYKADNTAIEYEIKEEELDLVPESIELYRIKQKSTVFNNQSNAEYIAAKRGGKLSTKKYRRILHKKHILTKRHIQKRSTKCTVAKRKLRKTHRKTHR